MRTTLDLPDPLFRELKARAAMEGVKMKELLAEIIEDGLRGGRTGGSRTGIRSPLPAPRAATGGTVRSLSNAEMDEILDAEEARGGN
jgi:hypothetical protein